MIILSLCIITTEKGSKLKKNGSYQLVQKFNGSLLVKNPQVVLNLFL